MLTTSENRPIYTSSFIRQIAYGNRSPLAALGPGHTQSTLHWRRHFCVASKQKKEPFVYKFYIRIVLKINKKHIQIKMNIYFTNHSMKAHAYIHAHSLTHINTCTTPTL